MAEKKKTSQQDNFYKKVSSSKGFSIQSKVESYSTIIQMIKSDVFQLQDMINENSSEIKMHKLLSKVPSLTKRLSEIEDSQDLKSLTEQLAEDSSNVDKLGKIYGCKNANELSQKLALELNYYELFVKKLSDYFLLLQLKHCGKTFQDTLSRILPIKTVMDHLIQKAKAAEETPLIPQAQSPNANASDTGKVKEYDSLIALSTFNEVIDSKGQSGTIFKHIHSLVNDYFINMNQTIENLFNKLSLKLESNNASPIESFLENQKMIIDLLGKNKEEISFLQMSNEGNAIKAKQQLEEAITLSREELKKQYKIKMSNQNEKIKQLQLELSNTNAIDDVLSRNDNLLKELNDNKKQFLIDNEKKKKDYTSEVNKLKQELQSMSDDFNKEKAKVKKIENDNESLKKTLSEKDKEQAKTTPPTQKINRGDSNGQINQSTVNEVLELIQARNRDLELFKKESKQNYESEIASLTSKLNKLTEIHNIIKVENKDLKIKLDHIQNKQFDADSYEQVLLSQFEIMKNAFTKKIADLTDELSENKNESRAKMYSLQEELKEAQNLKDVFLKQVLQLQKHLSIN